MAENAGAENAGEQEGGGGLLGRGMGILRTIMMYYMMSQLISKWRGGNDTTKTTEVTTPDGEVITKTVEYQPASNKWQSGDRYDIRLYLSETPAKFNVRLSEPIWSKFNLSYSTDSMGGEDYNHTITLTPSLQNNGSIYAIVIMSKDGYPYDEDDDEYEPDAVVKGMHCLVSYRRQRIIKNSTNLLWGRDKKKKQEEEEETNEETNEKEEVSQVEVNADGSIEESSEKSASSAKVVTKKGKKIRKEDLPIVSYFKKELYIRPLIDWTVVDKRQMQHIADNFEIDHETHTHWPVLHFDEFWTLQRDHIPLNDTLKTVSLQIHFLPITFWKYMMEIQVLHQQKSQNDMYAKFGMRDKDENPDDMKRMMIDMANSNPILVATTIIVSLLHTVFQFLAFKNDVQFWKNTKTVEGLSVRTVFLHSFFDIVIFLYLLDEETSWMILMTNGFGALINVWKITQAADVSVGMSGGWYNLPWISIKDKKEYIESETAKYDKEAMWLLSYVSFPLIIGYSIYSLTYHEHRGWYSFVLRCLVRCIYLFGFIMMCPQLYLNYKLKSVAHLPWRMLTYKFLTTIIDDLFSFIITMPTMHRMACFRDDVIFLIFLYQKWIYPVDYSRVNEYGYKVKNPNEIEGAEKASIEDTSDLDGLIEVDEDDDVMDMIACAQPVPRSVEDEASEEKEESEIVGERGEETDKEKAKRLYEEQQRVVDELNANGPNSDGDDDRDDEEDDEDEAEDREE